MASIYKRNGVWYVAMFEGGKRVYRSTGTTRKSEALRYLSQFQNLPEKRKTVRLPEFLRDFLLFSKANHAPSSYRSNLRISKTLADFLGDIPIDAIKPFDLERFKNLRLEAIKPVSVNIELRMLKAAFGYAVKWGLIDRSPFKGLSLVRIPQEHPAFLSEVQIKILLASISNPDVKDVVVFALHTGLRRGEILNLRWDSVDLINRVITVSSGHGFRTKTGRLHRIPMNEMVYDLLRKRKRTGEYVFTNKKGVRMLEDFVSHEFKDCVRLAGLPEAIHFHSMRHTFASLLAKMGVPLFDIQRLLNHSQISTTMIYSHLTVKGHFIPQHWGQMIPHPLVA